MVPPTESRTRQNTINIPVLGPLLSYLSLISVLLLFYIYIFFPLQKKREHIIFIIFNFFFFNFSILHVEKARAYNLKFKKKHRNKDTTATNNALLFSNYMTRLIYSHRIYKYILNTPSLTTLKLCRIIPFPYMLEKKTWLDYIHIIPRSFFIFFFLLFKEILCTLHRLNNKYTSKYTIH